jgi:uncharacterized protein (TIGR01319 family)
MSAGACALLIDFGSTYTKLRAVDLDRARIIGGGQGPSTVASDITVGAGAALADLERHIGALPPFQLRLASSSAAGGLAMVTVGLVPELTAEAARQAALGAGARLAATFAYKLTAEDARKIAALAPDLIVLAGGTDGGNEEVILFNAAVLAAAPVDCPVIVAGNRQAADAARERLQAGGQRVRVAGNVMPEFGVLDVESARTAIREIFIDHIVHAKGIDRAAAMVDRVVMPTPAAVLEGARLLADGYGDDPGFGPLAVIDVGGATTDVHSAASGAPTHEGVIFRGLPEPYLKRTVEGDLGMRHNAPSIVEQASAETVAADAGLAADAVEALARRFADDVEYLPATDAERAFDRALARAAVRLAMGRHAGTLETVHTALGPASVQHGKDLGAVSTLIGTGGVLAHGDDAAAILEAALADARNPFSLRPKAPRLLVDRDYVLFACGLLAAAAPAAALALARAHLVAVPGVTTDGRTSAA